MPKTPAKSQFNIRLPADVRADLAGQVSEPGGSLAGVAVTALREWTRMQEFPGIEFRRTVVGRVPYLCGTRLTVWDVHTLVGGYRGKLDAFVSAYPGLRRAQVETALSYAQKYRHEMPADEPMPSFVRVIEI